MLVYLPLIRETIRPCPARLGTGMQLRLCQSGRGGVSVEFASGTSPLGRAMQCEGAHKEGSPKSLTSCCVLRFGTAVPIQGEFQDSVFLLYLTFENKRKTASTGPRTTTDFDLEAIFKVQHLYCVALCAPAGYGHSQLEMQPLKQLYQTRVVEKLDPTSWLLATFHPASPQPPLYLGWLHERVRDGSAIRCAWRM